MIDESHTISKAKPQLRKYLEALFYGFRGKKLGCFIGWFGLYL